jgi:outer membrane protein assembly factor BamB
MKQMSSRPLAVLVSCVLLIVGAASLDAQWTQFRGPNGSGVDTSAGYPTEFSPTKNVAWKVAVPYGQSSPVVVGARLYLTASVGDQLITMCLDKHTGKELWRREVKRARTAGAYKANDSASPTPAADERGVVAFFPEYGLVSYTSDGQLLWTSPMGPFRNFYGMAASPIIAGGLVVQVCDQQAGSFVIALDRATGRQRWRNERPGMRIAWATPVVLRSTSAGAELIVQGSTRLDAYDLASGSQRWWVTTGAGDPLGTPVVHGDTVIVSTLASSTPTLPAFASTLAQYDKDKDGRLSHAEFKDDKDFGEHFGFVDANNDGFIISDEWNAANEAYVGEYGAVAVRPGSATGRLEPAAIQWRFRKNVPYIPALLVYKDVLYMVKTGGIVTSLDPTTGRLLKEGRSPGALGEYFASPVAADGKVYLASTEGKITVLQAAGEWKLLGVNDLAEDVHATPALSEGRIYVRTRGAMYCFSAAR